MTKSQGDLGLRRGLILILIGVTACGSDQTDPSAITRSDSLGVLIIDHPASFIDQSPLWEVETPPVLDLGGIDASPETQFFGIAAAGLLPTRKVLLIDRVSRELRVFDSLGRFDFSTGGPGEGPGEYGVPSRFWTRADTVYVWDFGLRRLSILGPEGTFHGTVRPDRLGRNAEVLTVFSDGTFLIKTFGMGESGPGLQTTQIHLTRFSGAGEFIDSLPSHPFTVMERVSDSIIAGGLLFSPSTETAGGSGSYWVGYGDQPELRHISADGELLQITRWEQDPVAVSPVDEDRYYDDLIERADPGRAGMIENLRGNQPLARTFPYYDQLCSAPEDGVWVREYRRPSGSGPNQWLMVNSRGEISGHLNTPAHLEVLECGGSYVLGVQRDGLDVEHLVLLSLKLR
jgi:hypothetical protein